MAINDRNSDDYREHNGNDRDWQRRGSQQRYGMQDDWQRGQDFQGQQDFQQQRRGGQGSMYGSREEQYSGREYGGGGQQFQQGGDRYGSSSYGGGYGGGRYGEYGGGYGGEMGDWNEKSMMGIRRQGGYRDEYGGMESGRNRQHMQGMGSGSRYGVGRELGGGMDANQPRLGHYGGGMREEMGGNYGSDMWNRDIENRRNRGWRGGNENQQSFSGRGPEGYNRSPERIREEVCELLTDDHRIDASKLSVDVKQDGIVELSGEIDSRRAKRVIEDICDNVRGVKDIRNNLRINDDFHMSGRSSNNGSMGSSNGSSGRSSTTKKS